MELVCMKMKLFYKCYSPSAIIRRGEEFLAGQEGAGAPAERKRKRESFCLYIEMALSKCGKLQLMVIQLIFEFSTDSMKFEVTGMVRVPIILNSH